uniref:Glutathione peroxidase n=1 Tax=Amblyomma maculatum TaxID=34609 RepID=G3MNL7_AMBMU
MLGRDMASGDNWKDACSIYDFTAEDITGKNVSLRKYAGHVVLIVNVASRCGFTDSNYKQLQALHDKYASNDPPLSILGFPCNQFGSQEPESNVEIADFCKATYDVKFDMFAKIDVNGDGAHPLWKFLKRRQSGTLTDGIKWNFTKFLVNRSGQPVARYAPTTEPNAIENDIKKLLTGASQL